jgi:hypothetical protein
LPVLKTFAERTVALYEQVGCVQTYSTEAGDVASLVRVKSPAVKIYALVFGILNSSTLEGVGVDCVDCVEPKVRELLGNIGSSVSGKVGDSGDSGGGVKEPVELMILVGIL